MKVKSQKDRRLRRQRLTERAMERRFRRAKKWGWNTHRGRFRKWNMTCGCPICRKAKFKDKGRKKQQVIDNRYANCQNCLHIGDYDYCSQCYPRMWEQDSRNRGLEPRRG